MIEIKQKIVLPQVRLELTTSACLVPPSGGGEGTDYKYGALTDCATGADLLIMLIVYTL